MTHDVLIHRTVQTGHARPSPRSEVHADVIAALGGIVARGGRIPGSLPWSLSVEALEPGRWRYIISAPEGELASCMLDATSYDMQLVVNLLPASLALSSEHLMMLADLERCIAWTLLAA